VAPALRYFAICRLHQVEGKLDKAVQMLRKFMQNLRKFNDVKNEMEKANMEAIEFEG
jgi:hypothetical protein